MKILPRRFSSDEDTVQSAAGRRRSWLAICCEPFLPPCRLGRGYMHLRAHILGNDPIAPTLVHEAPQEHPHADHAFSLLPEFPQGLPHAVPVVADHHQGGVCRCECDQCSLSSVLVRYGSPTLQCHVDPLFRCVQRDGPDGDFVMAEPTLKSFPSTLGLLELRRHNIRNGPRDPLQRLPEFGLTACGPEVGDDATVEEVGQSTSHGND